MKKSVYIILAVLIAAGMTAVQVIIANSTARKNQTSICIASRDLKKGNVLNDNDIEEIQVYSGDEKALLLATGYTDIPGKTTTRDIPAGSIISEGDILTDYENYEGMRRLGLEVSGENFNAGDFETGDFIDLFMIPDFEKLGDVQSIWLGYTLETAGIRYIPGKTPGILIENLLITYIDTATGSTAKYVSIRVPKPLDEAIAFLEQISVFEFIGR